MGLEVLVLIAPAIMLGGLFFGYLVRLERQGRAHIVVLILIGVVLVDAFFNGSQESVPAGLFRPTAGGLDLRLPDLFIPLALAARLFSTRGFRTLSVRSLLWMVFFAWYGVGIVSGMLFNNPVAEVLFQSKVVLWMGGAMILGAGVQMAELVSSKAYVRAVQVAGGVALILLAMKLGGFQFALRLPGLKLNSIGSYTPDAATVGVMIGLPMLLLELARPVRRVGVVVPCLVLMMMPLGAKQGAALVGLGASLVLVVLVLVGPVWRRRTLVRPVEVVLFVAAILGVGLFSAIASGEQAEITAAFEENIDDALFADVQAQTTTRRYELWDEAFAEISERPAFASGVGVRLTLNQPWPRVPRLVSAHNIYVDVAIRLGLIGFFFFVIALVSSVGSVIAVWRRSSNDLVATFILGVGIALAGLAAKGFAESILEKYRIIVIAGVFLGFVLAAVGELGTEDQDSAVSQSEKSMPVSALRSATSER